MSEPTPGEILRRLDEVARRLSDLAAKMEQDRATAAATYVRQDVYRAEQRAVTTDLQALQDARADETKFARDSRRQVLMLLASVAIPALFSLLLAVNNFLHTRGA